MIEMEAHFEEEDVSAARTQARYDFSVVRGFQVVGAEDHVAAQRAGNDEAWRDALRVELETRAARFRQAVDDAIVLSNDGLVRWLGDPVARLALGPNLLTPRTVILAEEALPAESREIVNNRIDLWLASTTRRLLAPLFALEAMQEGSAVVRDLASKLSQSFGILEREPIRRQVSALAQNERAELRKHGARFGAYYIFVPALIKPAPRTLALHLWSLRAPNEPDALMRMLGPLASSGRTSLPFDSGISRESYRVAGYRPCGQRIVRVDVVERLAGIIREAMVQRAPGVAPPTSNYRTSNGFVVSGQMTSLTGCSGEHFTSILRSLGFNSVEMSESEFFGSSTATESPEDRERLALIETARPRAGDQATSVAACERRASVDPVLASPDNSVLVDIEPPKTPADISPSDALGAEPASFEISSTSSAGTKNEGMIVVWRPEKNAPSHRATKRKSQSNGSRPPAGTHLRARPPSRADNVDLSPVPAAEQTRNKEQQSEVSSTSALADARGTATRPSPRADRADNVRPDKNHRQTAINRDMAQSHGAPTQQPRAEVDPNSPFAKLLELRSLLERQANKRP